VRVLGADEKTVFKVKGREVVVGFVVDATSGKTLGFEVLSEGDGRAFGEWLGPYAKERAWRGEVLVSDDNDSYGVAAAESGLSHQLCIAHVSKYVKHVKRRSKSILEQAQKEWGGQGAPGKLRKLQADLVRVKELIEELPGEGGAGEWAGCTGPTRGGVPSGA